MSQDRLVQSTMRFNRALVSSLMVRTAIPGAVLAIALLAPAHPVKAVPAYAEQTGMPCQSCHVGGFGPQLTPFGREFKLSGYTLRAKASVPLSAMGVVSFTHTRRDQNPAPDGFSANDNLTFDQGSVFIAGGAGKHLGGFAQITYDGVGKQWSWDNLDLRAVTTGHVFGKDAVFGLTLNNGPTIQDAWNTTPAWGFPYTDTAISGTPGAAPLIDGGLAQGTLGLGAYAWIGQEFYVEGGAYSTPAAGTLRWLGADPADPGDIHGLAPYGRIAFQHDLAGGTFEAGAFALKASLNPGRDRSTGLTDHYSDVGLDTSWQKTIGSNDTISAQMRYIHEADRFEATCVLGAMAPDCGNVHLDEWRGDLSYSWHNKVGATLGAFAINGTSNANLYDGPKSSPDSDGVMAQLDYTPWGAGNSPLGSRVNVRVGVQYTAYGKFDGARRNYDGAGANAPDNNDLRLFTWVAF